MKIFERVEGGFGALTGAFIALYSFCFDSFEFLVRFIRDRGGESRENFFFFFVNFSFIICLGEKEESEDIFYTHHLRVVYIYLVFEVVLFYLDLHRLRRRA